MEESDFSGLLIMAIIIVFLLVYVFNSQGAQEKEVTKEPLAGNKQCPPHKWKWHDRLGGGYFIKCEACKQTPSLSTRDDE